MSPGPSAVQPHLHHTQPPPRTSLTGAAVLVAEDNPVNLEVATFHLEDLGCTSVIAVNGRDAVARAGEHAFDFILMDCQMPVMDGFAALAAIRALGAANTNSKCTIIAVTADGDAQSRAACAAAGFDGFLAKPFSLAQLQATLLGIGDTKPAAAARSPSPDASDDVLDAAAFAAFVDDFGFDTAPSLLQSFVKLLADSTTRFDAFVAASDCAGLQALGHKLAGAAGTVGARRLAGLARQIDASGKKGTLRLTPDVLALKSHMTATHAALTPLCDEAALRIALARSRDAAA